MLVNSCEVLVALRQLFGVLKTPYLDEFGDEDIQLLRGQLLHLDKQRWDACVSVIVSHKTQKLLVAPQQQQQQHN